MTPQISGVIFFFSFKSLVYNSFTNQNIRNYIVLMYFIKCFSRPQPGLLHTHGLEGAPSSCVPERGVPRQGE